MCLIWRIGIIMSWVGGEREWCCWSTAGKLLCSPARNTFPVEIGAAQYV